MEVTAVDGGVVDRILDAAFAAAAEHGIRRLSMADVAQRAGLSRPTLYKHVGNLDAIVAATVQREMTRAADVVTVEVDDLGESDPAAVLESMITRLLRFAREHPLLDRLLRTEPEALLPVLTDDSGAATRTLRARAEEQLHERFSGLDPVVARRSADVLVRLLVSYAISAPDDPPELVARAVAAMVVNGTIELQRLAEANQFVPRQEVVT